MGKRSRVRQAERAAFSDDEERDIVESFEAALDRGEIAANPPEELAKINTEWKAIAEESRNRKAVSLRLQVRDLELIKSIAQRRGVPYQTLIGSVLHQFAHGGLREADGSALTSPRQTETARRR